MAKQNTLEERLAHLNEERARVQAGGGEADESVVHRILLLVFSFVAKRRGANDTPRLCDR